MYNVISGAERERLKLLGTFRRCDYLVATDLLLKKRSRLSAPDLKIPLASYPGSLLGEENRAWNQTYAHTKI